MAGDSGIPPFVARVKAGIRHRELRVSILPFGGDDRLAVRAFSGNSHLQTYTGDVVE